jgi:YD repeat-containing protein
LGAASAYWTSWSFDQLGDRTGQTEHGVGGSGEMITTSTYPTSGSGVIRPHAVSSISTTSPTGTVATSYGYDNTGNTTSRTRTGGDQSLTWTHTGNPTASLPGWVTQYVYDAQGAQQTTEFQF